MRFIALLSRSVANYGLKRIIFSASTESYYLKYANYMSLYHDAKNGKYHSIVYAVSWKQVLERASMDNVVCFNQETAQSQFNFRSSIINTVDPNHFVISPSDRLEILVCGHGSQDDNLLHSYPHPECSSINATELQQIILALLSKHIATHSANLIFFELNLIMCFGLAMAKKLQIIFGKQLLFPLITAVREIQIIVPASGKHEITRTLAEPNVSVYRKPRSKVLFYYGLGHRNSLEPRVFDDAYGEDATELKNRFNKLSITGQPV